MKKSAQHESCNRWTVRKIVILTLLAMAAASLVVLNVGEHVVRTANQPLLRLVGHYSAHAAARQAELQLAAGDTQAATRLSEFALRHAPLSATALRTLGLSLQTLGENERAAQLMALAGGLGWRDTPTQAWLVSAYLQQEDYGSAFERADALARRGQALERMIDLLLGAALQPSARPALIARLKADPSWRQRFFGAAGQLPSAHYAAYTAFLGELAAEGALRKEEATPFIRALFRNESYAEALRLWRLFGVGSPAGANTPTDGGFETAELAPSRPPSPFDWAFPRPPGSETGLSSPPGGARTRALHAASPGNARLEIARQVLVLPPGRHSLSYDVWGRRVGQRDGYSWLLTCLPKEAEMVKAPQSSTEIAGGGVRIRSSIEVPPTGCRAQTLRLVVHSGVHPLDLWFDNVVID